ncbi:C-terminal binding protein, partial [Trifolium medium]|nr:C-terminal binding protein [Trifolium medium]
EESIERRVGNREDTFFWIDPWLGGVLLRVKYRRIFDLSTNKTSSVAAMCELGWEEGGGVAVAPSVVGVGGDVRGVYESSL